jgi:hypothetical protein
LKSLPERLRGWPWVREIERMAVGEVASVGQVHPEHGVARLQHREVDRLIGLAAGDRLDVGVLGAEQLLGPPDGKPFSLIHELATTVVASAGIALGVLVGQDRSRRFQNRLAHEVLGGDQLESRGLPLDLASDDIGHLGIHFT